MDQMDTFSIPLASPVMLRINIISASGQISTADSVEDALFAVKNGGYFWLDYRSPTEEALNPLIHLLNIHPLSIEDCLNEEQLPKLELFPNYSFMIFNSFINTPDGLETSEIDIMLGQNFVITVSKRVQNGESLWNGLDRALEISNSKFKAVPSFLAHYLIDTLVDQKFQTIDRIEQKLEDDEDLILASSSDFNLATLLDSRRDLMTIRKALFYEREVVNKLLRKDSPFVWEASLIYFRDVYDHLTRYYEITESARDQVTNLMEIHLSMTSNLMAQSSNRTNAIMRRLTLITTIFMPLSLISGIGGMSEFTMMVGQDKWKIGYIILLGVMVVIAFINYVLLKKMERSLPDDAEY